MHRKFRINAKPSENSCAASYLNGTTILPVSSTNPHSWFKPLTVPNF